MANLSSLGIGSGLDANTIVSQLMNVERLPLNTLDTKITGVNTKISAFGSINSLLDTLKTAATTLADANKLAPFKAESSTSATLSATASSTAAAGSYSVNVQRLATAHKVSTDALTGTATTAVVGAGTMTISLGDDDPSTTSVDERSPITVTMGSGATLGDLRDAINSASGSKVTANIISTTSGGITQSKLILTAKDTGKNINTTTDLAALGTIQTVGGPHTVANTTAFAGGTEKVGQGTLAITTGTTTTNVTIAAGATLNDVVTTINGTAGVGVTASVFTDTTGTHLKLTATDSNKLVSYTAVDDDMADGFDFSKLRGFNSVGTPPQIAQTALLTIEGQSVESTSNTISSAISGVSLSLAQTGTTTLTVARDQDAAKTAVDSFVKAYNDLNTKMRSLSAYDATNKTSSTLTGDSTVRNIQNQLSSILAGLPGSSSGSYSRLSDLGITLGANGALSVDASKLTTAIGKDFASLTNVLNSYGSDFKDKITSMTKTGGLLSGKTDSLNAMIKSYNQQKDSLSLRLDSIEKRYRAQFTALDTAVASMQKTSTYLTQQLARL